MRSSAKGVGVAANEARVLVIDDDDGMREAIESLLVAAGLPIAGFESAEALLAADDRGGARCIVCDIRLGGMSGLELLGALRARGDACPVILITAHDTPAVRNEAVRLGALAYLSKPFAARELLDAIAGTPAADPATRHASDQGRSP
jgi:FixJ family two-component response regulator